MRMALVEQQISRLSAQFAQLTPVLVQLSAGLSPQSGGAGPTPEPLGDAAPQAATPSTVDGRELQLRGGLGASAAARELRPQGGLGASAAAAAVAANRAAAADPEPQSRPSAITAERANAAVAASRAAAADPEPQSCLSAATSELSSPAGSAATASDTPEALAALQGGEASRLEPAARAVAIVTHVLKELPGSDLALSLHEVLRRRLSGDFEEGADPQSTGAAGSKQAEHSDDSSSDGRRSRSRRGRRARRGARKAERESDSEPAREASDTALSQDDSEPVAQQGAPQLDEPEVLWPSAASRAMDDAEHPGLLAPPPPATAPYLVCRTCPLSGPPDPPPPPPSVERKSPAG